MHESSMLRMKWFVKHYVNGGKKVLDVGSYGVNGTYKELFKGMDIQYVGADIEKGPNVDVVLKQTYCWDCFEDEEFDYIISGQALEHIEYPWLTMQEIYKKLKWGGIICIIAPNSTREHKYPVDCYRYFGDGFTALAKWANFTVLDVSVAGVPEMSVSHEWDSVHNDVCLIAMKGSKDLLEKDIIKFPYERRYDEAYNLELCYNFMWKWINADNKRKILQDFIVRHNAKKICIYGYEYIGQLLYKELCKIDKIDVAIVDDKSKIALEGDVLIIITIPDCYREEKLYLDKVWKGIPKYYLDDIFILDKVKEFYKRNQSVYLYGAGVMAKRLANLLMEYGLKPCGFIVSDGKRNQTFYDDMRVFELSELQTGENVGIILAVRNKFKNAIKHNLAEKGFIEYLEL